MKNIKRILLFLAWTGSAYACDPGYYLLDDGVTCTPCLTNEGYYCPGDDTRHECPPDKTDWFGLTGCTYNSGGLRSWHHISSEKDGYPTRVSNCLTSFNLNCPQGRMHRECPWDATREDYFCDDRTWWYWKYMSPGYYACGTTGSGTTYDNVCECDNAPDNSVYTGAGDANTNNCAWECVAGYGRHADACYLLCAAGVTKLNAGEYAYNLYADKNSAPAIGIDVGGRQCWANLEPGRGGLTVNYGDVLYHAVD